MKVRLAIALLVGTSLWGGAVLGAAGTEAEKPQAARVIAPLIQDAETGYGLYRLSAPGDDSFGSRTVLRDPDGGWSVLHERFGVPDSESAARGGGVRDPEYKVWVRDRPGWYEQQYYYNLEDQVVYEGLSYIWSPDRSFGYALVSTPKPIVAWEPVYDWVERSLLVKDAATGAIREMKRFATRPIGIYWVNDSRLLLNDFNTKAKQNELSIVDMTSGETAHFAYGTAYAYDAARGEMLFVRNEPTRTRWIYDARTGHERKATAAEIARFEKEPAAAPEAAATDLDWRDLPVADPPIQTRNEHRIVVDGVSVELPYAFRRGGTLYIPVRPLLDGLGLRLEEKTGTAARYQFPLRSDNARVVLTPDGNSAIVAGRLYATQGVLQSLGFKNIRVESLEAGA